MIVDCNFLLSGVNSNDSRHISRNTIQLLLGQTLIFDFLVKVVGEPNYRSIKSAMAQQFRTAVPLKSYPFNQDHSSPVLCYGSCFAEHMASRLADRKFQTLLNPFGITYHPLTVAQGLRSILDGRRLTSQDLFLHNDLWHSFDFHSHYSHPDQATALQQMNGSLNRATDFLQQAQVLIVTLGTAYGFIDHETGNLVNNCHKLPAKQFLRKRFSPEEMLEPLQLVFQQLKDQQQDLQVILTVSPVRHLKDGMIENQRSKSVLLLLAEALEKQLDFVHYFPAYELVMDDLRDYRFYAEDMIHPNTLTVDYIWSYYQEAFFSRTTQSLVNQVEKIQQACSHRPFHPQTASHQAFVRQQMRKIADLQTQHPELDFNQEQQHFAQQLQ